MSTRSTKPSSTRRAASTLAMLAALLAASPAGAQLAVYDPANHVENALQAARALQSLTNEAQMLINQARQLAASPYSHLTGASKTLSDIADLAGDVRGVAADISRLEQQFEELYPALVDGLDPAAARAQAKGRAATARATAQDLATTAAELERLAAARESRMSGALSASEAAGGETAAIQSSTQMLAVLAEDLGSLRALMSAQSRLMAEQAARQAAERTAGDAARRAFYGHAPAPPAPPAFDPFPLARD